MSDFLEVVESFEGDTANARNIFQREDGQNSNTGTNRLARRIGAVAYKSNLLEAVKLIESVVKGRRSARILSEVMTTDDFPIYFADILDRTMLAKYESWPVTWTAYAKRRVLNDFRDAKLLKPVYGADTILDEVAEGAPYPDAAIHEQEPLTWSVKKYGRRIPFSWETIVNDDLNQLTDMPERLATAARRTEQRLVTNLFVGANGPNTTLYTAGNANIVNTTNGASATNPPLSISGLNDALTVLSKMVDESGEPILRDMMTLVVPPALQYTARNVINATEIWDSTALGGGQPDNGSTSGERILRSNNWMRNMLDIVVDPYIPTLASSANGNTSWFLFANPAYSREAITIGFLRGHESPEIWMKSPNAIRAGGGAVSPLSGDFDTDSVEYRVRHVTGVLMVDPKATVMSNGSGS